MQKKISFISTMGGTPWGGSEELWANTARQALVEGNNIQTITYEWEALPEKIKYLKELGAEVAFMKWLKPRANNSTINKIRHKILSELSGFFYAFPVNKLAKFNPDCVVISQAGTYDFIGIDKLYNWLIKNKKNYYIICQYNDEHRSLSKDIILKSINIFSNASQVYFVSERNRIVTERQLCYKLTNSRVISNPVNINNKDIIEYPSSNDTIQFAQVARLECTSKGQDILLQVLSSEKWKIRNWQLNFYGQGNDEQYLKKLVEFYNLEGKVNFKGHVNNIREVWKVNNILLLPSLREGTPLALAEAMLCGRPAVVTDVGGNTELIEEDKSGYIADGANFTSFDKALEKAWENRNYWEELGKNANTFIKANIDLAPEKTLLNSIFNGLSPVTNKQM